MTMSNDPQVKPEKFQEEHLIALLSSFQPHPRKQYYQQMRQAPWYKSENINPFEAFQSLKNIRRSTFAFLSIVLLLILFIFTPFLRSNARQFFRFFGLSEKNTRSIEVTYTPASTSDSPLSEFEFSLSLEEAAKAAGFSLHILSVLPEGVTLKGFAYDPIRKAVLTKYAGEEKTILFTQREVANVQEYANIGSNAPAELVMVRGVHGEFVTGGWVIEAVSTPLPESGSQTINLAWENQAGMCTLRWEENGFVYEIVAASSTSTSLEDIQAIAESMR